ncbi:MAG: FGGY family carbohydrate kinase [Syntrophales bacterium]|nr:FGGY family carbohydrate kinase [Syntrophales bacterium]
MKRGRRDLNRILAIDVGTQSLRVGVVDRDFRVLEKQQVSYTPQVISKNKVEIDPEILWNAFVEACKQLVRGKDVEGMSFSTLCPSLVPMDAEGRALGPMILHLDRRSYRQALWALERVGEDRFLQTAGNLPFPGGISLTSILWIKENVPSIYNRPDVVFGHAVTFFMKRLTGRFLIEPSNASFTGVYETVGYGNWDEGLLNDLEISRKKLPEVVMSSTVAGELDKGVADWTGLPCGIPIVIGANDTTCAAVGAGVTKPGTLMNTSGTVEILLVCLDRPWVGKDHLLRTHAYPNRWLAMRTVGAGGASLEWFRKNFCQEMSKEHFYSEYLVSVLSISDPPETQFHPFLSGDRHRVRQKSASFTRLSLSTTREDCLRAVAHGIVSFQVQGLREWEKKMRLERSIYHVGGGASEAYTQYKQRLLKGFKFIQLGETTLKGAAQLGFEAICNFDGRLK